MFDKSRVIQAGYTVIFPRLTDIQSRTTAFDSLLKEQYQQVVKLPVPEELPAEMPRLLYTSLHGHSQIIVSQVTCTFQVNFSADWQSAPEKIRAYLEERIGLLYEMVHALEGNRVLFAGLSLMMNLPSKIPDGEIINLLRQRLAAETAVDSLHDLEIKIVRVVEGMFFSNIRYKNYRAFPPPGTNEAVMPMPREKAVESGVQILGDFNDRFAYNEKADYTSPSGLKSRILDLAFREMGAAAKLIGGEP